MIEIKNLTKVFKSKNKSVVVALNDINLTLPDSGLVFIIGKSGSGKSTLLKAILGEVKHTGEIRFKNKDADGQKIKIGYVPQKLNVENSPMTVYDMISGYTSNKPVFLFKSKNKAFISANQY